MTICSCIKTDGKRCTRVISTKAGDNPLYCWQHQKCKNIEAIKTETVVKPRAIPIATLPKSVPIETVPKPVPIMTVPKPIPIISTSPLVSNTIKKIKNLAGKDNIVLILGASANEAHIRQYQAENGDKTIVGITDEELLGENKNSAHTLVLNFNKMSDMIQLLPLKNKINRVIFDYSTFKFATWDPEILSLFREILKPGGQLIIDCCNFGGAKFKMNYMDGKANLDPSCYIKGSPNVNKRSFNKNDPWYYEFFYYDYCEPSKRPFYSYDTEAAIFDYPSNLSKIINNITDFKEREELRKQAHLDYDHSLNTLLLGHAMNANEKYLEAAGFNVEKIYGQPYPIISSQGLQIADYLIATK